MHLYYNTTYQLCQAGVLVNIKEWIAETPGAREALQKFPSIQYMLEDEKKHELLKTCLLRVVAEKETTIIGFSEEASKKLIELSKSTEFPKIGFYEVYNRETIRGCRKILAKLGSAWFTYCYLRAEINRRSSPTFDGLEKAFIRGILGTIRTGPYLAEKLGVKSGTVYYHINKLKDAGLLCIFPYHYKGYDKPLNYLALGVWHITVDGTITEHFFLDQLPREEE